MSTYASTLNEGRSLNSGDTGTPPRPGWRARTPLNEGRSLNSGDTPSHILATALRPRTLNEGRSLNSGDTTRQHADRRPRDRRSTKAGA